MPFEIIDGKPVLRCINHSVILHEPMVENTTMVAEDEYNSLTGVAPPLPKAAGVPLEYTTHPRLDLKRGLAVICYVCVVCGYVEMYDAAIVEPGRWGRP